MSLRGRHRHYEMTYQGRGRWSAEGSESYIEHDHDDENQLEDHRHWVTNLDINHNTVQYLYDCAVYEGESALRAGESDILTFL